MLKGSAFKLLAVFRERNTCSFVEMCEQAGYPTDLGGYYLRQLVEGGYLTKQERGVYAITPKGKAQFVISYGRRPSIPRPRLLVLLIAERGGRLVALRRTTQPYIGVVEWPGASVLHGEPLEEAVVRTIQQRLGGHVSFAHHGFFRRIDMYGDDIFDDKLFVIHKVALSKETSPGPSDVPGELLDLTETELRHVAKPSRSLLAILDFALSPSPGYVEQVYHLQASDLEE